MSAKSWSVCPKCLQADTKAWQEARAAVRAAYGKVTEAEYRELAASAELPPPEEQKLAHYYDIGVNSLGKFEVNYVCECRKCGFEFRYKYEISSTAVLNQET
jgi:hypothetical protein